MQVGKQDLITRAMALFEKLIGDETDFSLKQRILNMVLLMAIAIAVLCSVVNSAAGLTVLAVINVSSTVILLVLYYLARVKEHYLFTVTFVVFIFGFVTVSVIWVENNGILGEAPYFIIMCSGMIAVLFSGRLRLAMLGCLLIMSVSLMFIDHNVDRYPHLYFSLLATVMIQVIFFALMMNYQIKEALKAQDFASTVEQSGSN